MSTTTDPNCKTDSLAAALAELDQKAPKAPLLALGQTIFWDEPMKFAVYQRLKQLGSSRKLVAGVHDVDYFAKLPGKTKHPEPYVALPHNDTTTKDIWSAAAEFSALFGGETVITRDALLKAGAHLPKVLQADPEALDRATEAYGWKGIVSTQPNPQITAETLLQPLLPTLFSTLDWAAKLTIDSLLGEAKTKAEANYRHLRTHLCDSCSDDPDQTLAEWYECLLPSMSRFVTGEEIEIETSRTTRLLQFNTQTCGTDRFGLLGLFVNPATRQKAKQAYNDAVEGSEIYTLDRFGTGAIPFDIVIPGRGRANIRLGEKAAVLMFKTPEFLDFEEPLESLPQLAAAIEAKFGPDCAIIGKAITLIGMLAAEHVFVFHEGASGYLYRSREFHQKLTAAGLAVQVNPVLRVRYETWDALANCSTPMQLPEILHGPFQTDQIEGHEFAARWRKVAEDQTRLLEKLGTMRSPLEMISYLAQLHPETWQPKKEQYEALLAELRGLQQKIDCVRCRRRALYADLREARQQRIAAEQRKGDHFRATIFEKDHTETDLQERERLSAEVEKAIETVSNARSQIRQLLKDQSELSRAEEVQTLHRERRTIECEAEMMRLQLIREAVTASKGLERAGKRPSAWWFPLVCPERSWLNKTIERACYSLEPLD
ncbi:MAG: hypothetical protein ACK4P3_04420 [Fimbriimonadaceae bacterium]